jgi:DNA-binding XRE family transcriptional regulator
MGKGGVEALSGHRLERVFRTPTFHRCIGMNHSGTVLLTGRSNSRLYQLRSERGWSLEELAARAGVSPRTIYNAEVGDRRPQRATRRVLADALGCQPDDINGNDPGEPGRFRKDGDEPSEPTEG